VALIFWLPFVAHFIPCLAWKFLHQNRLQLNFFMITTPNRYFFALEQVCYCLNRFGLFDVRFNCLLTWYANIAMSQFYSTQDAKVWLVRILSFACLRVRSVWIAPIQFVYFFLNCDALCLYVSTVKYISNNYTQCVCEYIYKF
jgi:hypothetical protein